MILDFASRELLAANGTGHYVRLRRSWNSSRFEFGEIIK